MAGRWVGWVLADVRRRQPSGIHLIWHERAVLYVLTDPADRAAYRATTARAVGPGGSAVIGALACAWTTG